MITLLGNYLRKARVDLELSLRGMAEKLEVSPAYLSAIETGKRDIKEDMIEKMASMLKIATDKDLEGFKQLAIRSNADVSCRIRDLNDATAETVTLLARHAAHLTPETAEKIKKLTLDDLKLK